MFWTKLDFKSEKNTIPECGTVLAVSFLKGRDSKVLRLYGLSMHVRYPSDP